MFSLSTSRPFPHVWLLLFLFWFPFWSLCCGPAAKAKQRAPGLKEHALYIWPADVSSSSCSLLRADNGALCPMADIVDPFKFGVVLISFRLPAAAPASGRLRNTSVLVHSAGPKTKIEPFNEVPVCIPAQKASETQCLRNPGSLPPCLLLRECPQDAASPLEWSWPSVRVALTPARFNL